MTGRSEVAGSTDGVSRPRTLTRARFWIATVACLIGIAVFAGLGTWQVERLYWKEALIATIDARIHAPPQSLPEIEARYTRDGDVEYWPVRLEGRFLNAGERHFLSTFEGAAGWNVYTPLLLPDGRALFVNRGFVPYDRKDAATRAEGLLEGPMSFEAIARNPPSSKPSSLMPDNDLAKNTFFWKSVADMSVGLDLPAGTAMLPFFADAKLMAVPGGLPVGGTTVVELPNDHLQYAITWYGLALSLLVMLVLFWVRGAKAASQARHAAKG